MTGTTESGFLAGMAKKAQVRAAPVSTTCTQAHERLAQAGPSCIPVW